MTKQHSFRSILYVPADKPRAVAKIFESPDALGADVVIFDLEDAVTPERKAHAREALRDVLAMPRPPCRVFVRINGLDTEWGTEDFLGVLAMLPDGIVLPKVEKPEDIDAALSACEASDAPPGIALWAMIESPMALLNIVDIAAKANADDPRLEALMLGTNDLALATGTPLVPGRAAYLPWIMQCLTAARAYGLAMIDGVFTSLLDERGYVRECEQGAELGLDGKSLIHPKQIAPCNNAFTPDSQAVKEAQAICKAFADPQNAGKAVLTVNNKMVEFLHLESARRTLSKVDISRT